MSLNFEYSKVENFLIRKGYTLIDRGLIVFGGRDNGTVDLKATNDIKKESIIIELKNNPIHLFDISRYLNLKRNIESHLKTEKLTFYLLTTDEFISPNLKKIAKEKGIIVEGFNEFINKEFI